MRKLWILLAVLAIVLAGFAVFAIAQKSASEFKPVPMNSLAQDPLAADVFDQRVSAEFQDASLSEVLRWLGGTGVNFVADPASAGDAKVTLKVKDVPLRDVLRALEQVFNGTWTKNGEVYSFRPKARPRLEGFVAPRPIVPPLDQEELNRLEELAREMRERMEEPLRRFYERLPEEFRRFEQFGPGSPRFFRFEMGNVGKLFDSITEEQWRRHAQQGYLTLDDLTPQQRAMLGNPDGSFSMSLNINGRTLNIRSGSVS
jgi:hypothetical protein